MEATRSRHGWVHMFITHRPTVTLQLHNFDFFRTCRTSSFCTVAWQLAKFQLIRRWASCYYWFEANYFRVYATNLCLIFRIGSLMGVDDGCVIGLRSHEGFCHGSHFFVHSIHTIFSSQWPMCVMNFVHRPSTVDEVCWRWGSTPEKVHFSSLRTDISPYGYFPLRHFPDIRVRQDTTRSASAALDVGEPINWPINNG